MVLGKCISIFFSLRDDFKHYEGRCTLASKFRAACSCVRMALGPRCSAPSNGTDKVPLQHSDHVEESVTVLTLNPFIGPSIRCRVLTGRNGKSTLTAPLLLAPRLGPAAGSGAIL